MKRHLFCLNIFCIKKMGARLAVAQATVAKSFILFKYFFNKKKEIYHLIIWLFDEGCIISFIWLLFYSFIFLFYYC